MLPIRFKYMEPLSRNYDLNKGCKILTSNISGIYGPIILPKEGGRELSKIYLYEEFQSDLVNFTPLIVRHGKLYEKCMGDYQLNRFIYLIKPPYLLIG